MGQSVSGCRVAGFKGKASLPESRTCDDLFKEGRVKINTISLSLHGWMGTNEAASIEKQKTSMTELRNVVIFVTIFKGRQMKY